MNRTLLTSSHQALFPIASNNRSDDFPRYSIRQNLTLPVDEELILMIISTNRTEWPCRYGKTVRSPKGIRTEHRKNHLPTDQFPETQSTLQIRFFD